MTHRQLVKDGKGNAIGFLQPTTHRLQVSNKSGRLLGWCQSGKTYDAQGRLVSLNEVPGILLK